ncbi:PAS domain-containing sensor histidine kinase [Mesorhizobium loti]|nr:ATP-binding protein [Mesorhizobium loti]PLP56329.1 PAS domain-containing sensor histidine kinase [Mesorhizobium loti]
MKVVAGDCHAISAPSHLSGFRRPRGQGRAAHQSATDAVLVVDAQGMILFANAVAGRMFDRQPDELLRAVFGCPLTNAAGTEIVVDNPVRGGIPVELRVSETLWGGLPAVLVRLRDVSRRKARQARQRRAQKLEATGRLAAGVAHDFNNLVAVLESGLRLLQRRLGGDPATASLIEEMLGRTHNGAALAQRLLSFAGGQSSGVEMVDPNERIVSIAGLLNQTLGKGIEINTELDPGVEAVRIDGDQLDIALLNLAINARDAMAGKGKLFITTAGGLLQPVGETGEIAPFIRISVTDTGCGISGEILAQVMEPFFTTKGPEQGTGLGLSQVYDFARQSGGHVQIESQVGEGTTVHLFLPVPSTETPGGTR